MIFYLGTHRAGWLAQTQTPLFVSRRQLADRKRLPRAAGRWVLDSGGYTELHLNGGWSITPSQYAAEARRYAQEIGGLDWVAPMDWMTEPSVRARTGLSVAEHQQRTITNYRELRETLGRLVVPVLQGWESDDYSRHVDAYLGAGVDLAAEPVIGVGSICRRGQDGEIGRIVRGLAAGGLRLHGFGVRSRALAALSDSLVSADSMAWSYHARKNPGLPDCTHRNCANCRPYAERWHTRTLAELGQMRLWGAT